MNKPSFFPNFHWLKEYTKQDEGDAKIEGEINLTALAEDEEGKDDGVTGLEVVCQVDGEGREALQGLNL